MGTWTICSLLLPMKNSWTFQCALGTEMLPWPCLRLWKPIHGYGILENQFSFENDTSMVFQCSGKSYVILSPGSSRLRRIFNVNFSRRMQERRRLSRRIWERWRQQHLSNTKNTSYLKTCTVFSVSPSSSWQCGLLQAAGHETRSDVLAGTNCAQASCCWGMLSPQSCLHTGDW